MNNKIPDTVKPKNPFAKNTQAVNIREKKNWVIHLLFIR